MKSLISSKQLNRRKRVGSQNLGKNIRLIRESRNVSQKDLAAGVNSILESWNETGRLSGDSTVSKIEKGERSVTAIELFAIAQFLEFPISHRLNQENSSVKLLINPS